MKIGIITMHRVRNYGSALQAYALQKKIADMGYECELIDYIYPYPQPHKYSFKKLIKSFVIFLRNAAMGFPIKRKEMKFKQFRQQFFVLSKDSYTHESIISTPPDYNIYISGSDQVWNPKFIGKNTDFMLGFAPKQKYLISYASSFATDKIPENLLKIYNSALSAYSSITVREDYGVELVRKIVNKKALTVCDPVILLSKKEWERIANLSNSKKCEPYILAYLLDYMFDPFPSVLRIVDIVQQALGYKVIFLDGRKELLLRSNSKLVKDAGPIEFLSLVANARFVITTSFHGTAFSAIFGKPFLGVVKDRSEPGDRIHSLLIELGCESSLMAYNDSFCFDRNTISKYVCSQERLLKYRHSSLTILSNMLSNKNKM